MRYDQDTKVFAIVGDPVSHSLSPFIQNRLMEMAGYNGLYIAIRLGRGELATLPLLQRSLGLSGWNVTMPHKEGVLALLAKVDPSAAQIASVNTVVVTEQGWHGFSGDGPGFLRSLRDVDFTPAGKRVTLLGAGGAGRALAYALAAAGAREIVIVNRDVRRAEAWIKPLDSLARVCPWGDKAAFEGTDLLVNTTPLGMHGVAADFKDLSLLGSLPGRALVADLIYQPVKTRFLAAAEARRHTCINGLGMLVHQAALAFSIFGHAAAGARGD